MENKISVVVCTYNGEKFLSEQLLSIMDQIRQPDEIIISDDHSTDRTMDIAQGFIKNSTIPIVWSQNEFQLGYIKNFEYGIQQASGDLIFLSDQDDVWEKDKTALFEEVFNAHEKAGLLFSDADVVDEQLKPLNYSMWEHVGLNKEKFNSYNQVQLIQYLIEKPRITGATIAFRKKYLDQMLPFSDFIGHDEWLALHLAVLATIVPIPQKLIQYRQHGGNQIGAIKEEKFERAKGKQAKYLKEKNLASSLSFHYKKLRGYLQFYEQAKKNGITLPKAILAKPYHKMVHHRNRLWAYQAGAKGYVMLFKELGTLRYFKHANGLRGFISDLMHI